MEREKPSSGAILIVRFDCFVWFIKVLTLKTPMKRLDEQFFVDICHIPVAIRNIEGKNVFLCCE